MLSCFVVVLRTSKRWSQLDEDVFVWTVQQCGRDTSTRTKRRKRGKEEAEDAGAEGHSDWRGRKSSFKNSKREVCEFVLDSVIANPSSLCNSLFV